MSNLLNITGLIVFFEGLLWGVLYSYIELFKRPEF